MRKFSTMDRSSNRTPPSGLRPFFLGVAAALIFSTAFNSIFSPSEIQKQVSSLIEKSNLKYTFAFDFVELRLADGFLPRLGVKISNLKARPKDPCSKDPWVIVESVYFPFSVKDLLYQKVKFQTVRVTSARVLANPSVCPRPVAVESSSVSRPSSINDLVEKSFGERFTKVVEGMNAYFPFRWPKEIENTMKVVEGLEVDSFYVDRDLFAPMPIKLTNISLSPEKTPAEARLIGHGELILEDEKAESPNPRVLPVDFTIGNQNVSVAAEGVYREGRVSISLNYKLGAPSVRSSLKFHFFPGDAVVRLLNFLELASLAPSRELFWLSCNMDLEVPWKMPGMTFLQGDQCSISGDLIQLEVPKFGFRPWHPGELKTIDVQVQNFQLGKLFRIMKWSDPSQAFLQYGAIQGNLELSSGGNLGFKGTWKNPEFRLKVEKYRKRVRLDSVNLDLKWTENRLVGKLSQFFIGESKIEGFLSFASTGDFSRGFMQWKLDSVFSGNPAGLRLSSEMVAKSLLGLKADFSTLTEIQAYGSGQWSAGWNNIDLQGAFGIGQMKGDWGSAQDTRILFRSDASGITGTLRSKKADLKLEAPLRPIVEKLSLGYEKLGDGISLTTLESQFSWVNSELSWNRGIARIPSLGIHVSSSGRRSREGEVSGKVSVDFPSLKLQKFEVMMMDGRAELVPDDRTLRGFAKALALTNYRPGLAAKQRLEMFQEFLNQKKVRSKVESETF